MLVRRNTKAFKSIQEIITTCQDRPDRQSLIRLYITKAGHSLEDRIGVEGTQGEALFFYDLNYQAVQNNLRSSTHQLHHSDDMPGIYYFRSNLGTEWDETPFEFDTEIKNIFASLPDLPVTKAKGKTKEFMLPPPDTGAAKRILKKQKEKGKPAPVKQAIMTVSRGRDEQPDYKLKHDVTFTDLDKIAIWKGQLSKRDVLDYYDKVSEYLLPYLKDRPIKIRTASNDSGSAYIQPDEIPKRSGDLPDWVHATASGKQQLFYCNDKDHLMLYIELGTVEFAPFLSKSKSLSDPDQIVIGITSDMPFAKIVEVANTTKVVLDGLNLPAMIKTNGNAGLHVHVPLDAKSDFESARHVGEYVCRFVHLKLPDLVSLDPSAENNYNKVILDHSLTREQTGVVAPYSFGRGGSVTATPLFWDELTGELDPAGFNHQTIVTRLKKAGDPFEKLFNKKANADDVLTRIEEFYSFLF